jgi:hypothetical protein
VSQQRVVTKLKVIPPYTLDVSFDDGKRRRIDIEPLLFGPVFEPLREPQMFAEAKLDPELGTVTWPNGADLSPEFLYNGEESAEPGSG